MEINCRYILENNLVSKKDRKLSLHKKIASAYSE